MEIDEFALSINNNVTDYKRDGSPNAWVLTATHVDTTIYLKLKTLDKQELLDMQLGETFKIEYDNREYEVYPTEFKTSITDDKIYIADIYGITKNQAEPKLK
jgi:hypothetical protein